MCASLAFGSFVRFAALASHIHPKHFGFVAATFLPALITGSLAGYLAYRWASRRAAIDISRPIVERLIQQAITEERKRIALDLHDTVCQAHTGAILQLECTGDLLADDAPAREHLQQALQLIRESATEMRCSLWDLFPESLQKDDLKSAIESMVKDLTFGNTPAVRFSIDGIVRRLPPETERVLLRISREALSNAVRHAHAQQVRIDLCLDSQWARLQVKDDGEGFLSYRQKGTFGLTSMQHRTLALGGTWTIRSEPGRGTEVRAQIPIPPARIRTASTSSAVN